jgi:hypothetical protein
MGGHHRLRTSRPAPYLGRYALVHFHPVVKEPRRDGFYIVRYGFEDAPLMAVRRSGLEGHGGSGIVKLARDGRGVWVGRGVILGRNDPDFD